MRFSAEVVIENKPAAKDPEGETISRDLLQRNGFETVKGVRTAKLLRISLEAKDEREARALVERMCRELRLVNPVAQIYSISVKRA
ncbi:MAG: phosphoribosylformylglycinamidine synthase subunit PurS [Candidatus Micrarchaeia archaeon]